MNSNDKLGSSCPLPISEYPKVLLAHGGGGKLMHQLIEKIFVTAFANPELETSHDGAVLDPGNGKIAFSTDSYVVDPLFFPGGDIGMLAVNGTVNDLTMCGARPLYLSAAFIIEEGLATETLWNIAQSMRTAADTSKVRIVTGDTKVVDRGHGHGVFISTAGVGVVASGVSIGPASIVAGDLILLSGDIGRHGMAVMARREGLSFETEIESDCAPLNAIVMKMLDAGIDIHCLRDLTRGGLATALVEIANSSGLQIEIVEEAIPVCEQVRGACEILGFDPLYVANEGRFVAFVPEADAQKALQIMRSDESGKRAGITGITGVIGKVTSELSGLVTMRSTIGAERILDMLSGEQLPRIC